MGLDSVELVITIEKRFAITISDQEAEKAFTVQDVTDLVGKHRPLVPSDRNVRLDVCSRLVAALPSDMAPIADATPFAEVCQGRKPSDVWAAWSGISLKLPGLPPKDKEGKDNAFLLFLLPKWMSGRSVLDLTFGQVLDAIVTHNHKELIDPLKPASAYEILMAVIGVSSDSIGVAELEIRPTGSYTNDLGVD